MRRVAIIAATILLLPGLPRGGDELPAPGKNLLVLIEKTRVELVDAGQLVTGAGGVSKPEKRYDVPPAYPRAAEDMRGNAYVALKGLIAHSSGKVRNISVLGCSHPGLGLEESAIRAVKKWRYEEPTRRGMPVDHATDRLRSPTRTHERPGVSGTAERDSCGAPPGLERNGGCRPARTVCSPADVRKSDIDPPSLKHRVEPLYPAMAKEHKVAGQVALQAVIAEDGKPTNLEVLLCSPPGWGFERAAMDAVGQWEYEPASLLGRPVCVYSLMRVTFSFSSSRAFRRGPALTSTPCEQ